ncbi:peptidylprolyl isomerase [Candidatus Woesearchaeota archaeon]|nr:peptidylprolyl isomerase [Candidatus Woesearchaeota archaeon]
MENQEKLPQKAYKETYIFPEDSPLKKVQPEPKPEVQPEPEIEEIKIEDKKTEDKKRDDRKTDDKKAPKKAGRRMHKAESHGPEKTGKKEEKDYTLYYALGALALIAVVVLLYFFASPSDPGTLEMWDGRVIAVVNGEEITIDDFNTQVSKIPVSYRLFVTKDMILNQTIMEALLIQDAHKNGLTVDQDRLDNLTAVWEANLKSAMSEEELYSTLDSLGMTYDEFRQKSISLISDQLLISDLFNKTVVSKLELSEDDLKGYYDENKGTYFVDESLEVSHILVLGGPQMNKTDDEAREIILGVEKRIADGDDFFGLVREYSEDPGSKDNDGKYNITRGMTVKEFEDAAFALDVGMVSPIVKTQFGYHIIKLLGRTEARQMEFDEVRDEIREQMLYEAQKTGIPLYIAGLMDKAKIELFAFNSGIPSMDITTFQQVDPSVCTDEDNRTIVRLYTVSYQEASQFAEAAFRQALERFDRSGELSAYVWQVDTNDDVMTPELESAIPQEELDLFRKYNPGNSVPAYLIGCKYLRIGNGHWENKDMASETLEIEAMFDEIIFELENAEAFAEASQDNPYIIQPEAQ